MSIAADLACLLVMVCILAKGSGDCPITRIPRPSAPAAFAELGGHYPRYFEEIRRGGALRCFRQVFNLGSPAMPRPSATRASPTVPNSAISPGRGRCEMLFQPATIRVISDRIDDSRTGTARGFLVRGSHRGRRQLIPQDLVGKLGFGAEKRAADGRGRVGTASLYAEIGPI